MSTETPKSDPTPTDAAATAPYVTTDDAKRVVEEATRRPRGVTADAPSLPSNIVARREVLPINSGTRRVKP
jgi:hypothetical protein